MKRGDLYRIYRPSKDDPKKYRVYLVVSRQKLVDNPYSNVICAPVYTKNADIETQVEVGADEGLKHDSVICCDELLSISKFKLTNYVGHLSASKMEEVNTALRVALAV